MFINYLMLLQNPNFDSSHVLFFSKKINVDIYFGKADYKSILPSNYLGDGKGYEPDIWATTETIASVLTGLGVDVSGIIFQ